VGGYYEDRRIRNLNPAILAGKRKISATLAGKLGKFFGISALALLLAGVMGLRPWAKACPSKAHPQTPV
jgi:hypothetical protein